MGLDWMVNERKPKLGFDTRFEEVSKLVAEADEDTNEYTRLKKDLEAVSISVYEEIGCPRIGIDTNATEWWEDNIYAPAMLKAKEIRANLPYTEPAKDKWEEKRRDRDKDYAKAWLDSTREDCLSRSMGRYVVELAKVTKGVAEYTGIACSSLDFRGKMIGYVDGLDQELSSEAYDDHTPDECLDYADRLEEAMADTRGSENIEVLVSAIKWLRFWGGRGFGYWAWY